MSSITSQQSLTDTQSLRVAIQPQLQSGERVLWVGQPQKGLMLRSQDAFLIPFSLLWCGFAIFWEASVATSHNAPAFFLLWGAAFVAVGLYIVFGRFITDATVRDKTVYAVTNERVLIRSGLWTIGTRSLYLDGLSEMNVSDDANRRGTITFGSAPSISRYWNGGWPGAAQNMPPAFERIEDVHKVFALLRDAQKASRREP